ncbi:hypothetical protein D8674_003944 [Pyrus ussuriensis x Pyrus communis]|uniref:Uncharacterized protein n=1 Tax=Pyrus ussuriensis x Pyrus communis TaxID=2448454 RepID=A0A5N5FIH4_9ROSA|nr:hypothetical protein D8674_003944 [Pyrus ussuriensis x Pyrus communis]
MSESGSLSDEGFPSSSSRFVLAMLESSGPLLESCTKETLDDLCNCQTLANIGSSSFMSVGEWVLCDAIPICRSEFTSDHLEKNLLDSEKQLEALRQSCSIPYSIRMPLVHHEELPFEPPKGHIMFYTQILLTLVVKLLLHPWLQRMLSFIGYAPGQFNPGFWDTLIGFYIIWMECGLGEPFFHQWRYYYKMHPMKTCTVEKVSKKWGTSTKKGKTPMLVLVYDILFHKEARKHQVRPSLKPKSQEEVLKITASKKAEAEAIGCATAIVAGEER